MKWLYLFEQLIKLEWSELTPSCASQMKTSLKRKFIKISFVLSLRRFFIRMILNNFGYFSLNLDKSLNNFKIYFSLEAILHLIRSPILKLMRLGGDLHRARPMSFVSYTLFDTLRRPWISRLR